MDYLNRACTHTKDLLLTTTPAARIVIGLLLAVAAISLAFLLQGNLGEREEYLLGGRNFSTEELTDIEAAFSQAGLNEYKLAGNCIQVPRDKKAAYVGAMADANALPPDFNEIMDQALTDSSPWESREKQQARLKNAKQKELALILRAMKDIDRATVQYDIEQGRGFPRTKTATAMVAVRPAPGTELDPRRVRSIRDLVAASIAGLQPEEVTVMDLNKGGNFPPEFLDRLDHGDPDFLATQQDYEEFWRGKVREALSYIPDIVVVANVELGTAPQPIGQASNSTPPRAGRRDPESLPIVPSGAVKPSSGQAVAVHAGPEAGHLSDRETSLPGAASLFPAAITVTVGIPSNYYVNVWRQRTPTPPGSALTAPARADLEKIEAEVKTNVDEIVSSLLAMRTGENRPDRHVKVTTHQSLPTVEQPPTAVAATAITWLGDHWATWGMILVGALGLVTVRRLVRTAPAATGSETTEGSSSPKIAGRSEDPPESQHEPPRPRAEPSRSAHASETNLKMDLADMVRKNPDTAAAILNNWIADSA